MRHWLLLPCLALSACRTATYEPVTPHVAHGGGAHFELEQVRLERAAQSGIDNVQTWLHVTLSGRWPEQVAGIRVYLNSAYGSACEGQEGYVTFAAGRIHASWLHEAAPDLQGPTSVDVLLRESREAPGTCLRLPLANGSPEGRLRLTGRNEWLIFTRLGLEFSSSPVTWSIFSTSLGAGSWLGPLRVSLSTGIGSARCQASLCGEHLTEDGKGKQLAGGLSLPIDVDIEGFVWSRYTNALALGLRPGFRLSWFDEAPELHRRVAFTPALVLSYWAIPARDVRPSLSHYAQPERLEGAGAAFELPIGLWQDLDLGRPTGLYVGFGGRLALPID